MSFAEVLSSNGRQAGTGVRSCNSLRRLTVGSKEMNIPRLGEESVDNSGLGAMAKTVTLRVKMVQNSFIYLHIMLLNLLNLMFKSKIFTRYLCVKLTVQETKQSHKHQDEII